MLHHIVFVISYHAIVCDFINYVEHTDIVWIRRVIHLIGDAKQWKHVFDVICLVENIWRKCACLVLDCVYQTIDWFRTLDIDKVETLVIAARLAIAKVFGLEYAIVSIRFVILTINVLVQIKLESC